MRESISRTLAGSGVSFTWLDSTGGEGGELAAQPLSISAINSASRLEVVQFLYICFIFLLLVGSVLGLELADGDSVLKGQRRALTVVRRTGRLLLRQGSRSVGHAQLLCADGSRQETNGCPVHPWGDEFDHGKSFFVKTTISRIGQVSAVNSF